MNTISQKIIKIIGSLGLLSVISASFLSCSSRDEEKVSGNTGGTVLSLNVTVADNGGGISALASASQRGIINSSNLLVPIAESNMVSSNGFDAIVSAEGYKVGNGAVASVSGGISPVAATQPMPVGIKYRFLLYDGTGTTLISNTVGVSGTNPNISADAGQSYKWVAFSINDPTLIPDVTSGVISRSDISNKDVLYASGTITPVSGQNDLSVDFAHKASRIVVSLDTRGMFGTINNATMLEVGAGAGAAFAGVLQTGDLNVIAGTFSNFQNIAPVAASAMSNDAINGPATGATGAKIANFYTVNPVSIAANTLKVRIAPLNIAMSDATTRNFSTGVLSYSNTALTPAIGTSYSMTARMVESGVVVKGVTWARTNLYYDPAVGQLNKYRFHPDNEYTIANLLNITVGNLLSIQLNGAPFNIDNEYWNWMSSTPTGTNTGVDPCTRVFPLNTWRMPTGAEFTSLGAVPDGNDVSAPLIGGARIASVWNLDVGQVANASFPTNSQKLFLPMFGYRNFNSLVGQNQITDSPGSLLSLVVASGASHYWTSVSVNTNDANAHYRPYTAAVVLPPPLPPVLEIWGNATVAAKPKVEGRNIRCVRS